jgi:biopolymer transport protein ExbD
MAFYTPRKRKPGINIVSLIDILAILLIFFVVTTTFKKPEAQLKINLPESKTAVEQATPAPPVILSVTREGEVFLGEEPLSIAGLPVAIRRFQEENPGKTLALKADKEVPFGVIIRIMDGLKAAGIGDLPTFADPEE